MNKLPVLMIVFNRPETTEKVFAAVREYAPEKLYVAADGPRPDKPDAERCAAVRKIFDRVDWPCEVKTRFREQNLGCRKAPPDAVGWFFEQEEEGVILEDDCLPSQDFFRFCAEMLARYRNDDRIMMAAGSCYFDRALNPEDYTFSQFTWTWGWASTRKAWRHFDLEMPDFPEFKKQGTIRELLPGHPFMQWRYLRVFQKCYEKSVYFYDVWDWMWTYAVMKNRGLCIVPNFNLVSNIGDLGATHVMDSRTTNRPFRPLPETIQHPPEIKADQANDRRLFNLVHRGDWKDRVRFLLHCLTGKDWM